jgi:hypothetical protein
MVSPMHPSEKTFTPFICKILALLKPFGTFETPEIML